VGLERQRMAAVEPLKSVNHVATEWARVMAEAFDGFEFKHVRGRGDDDNPTGYWTTELTLNPI
jgi:hypothetical protein